MAIRKRIGATTGVFHAETCVLDGTTGVLGTKTESTDWSQQINIYKMQLKLLSLLYEYEKNLNGTESVAFTKVKIVDSDGKLIDINE